MQLGQMKAQSYAGALQPMVQGAWGSILGQPQSYLDAYRSLGSTYGQNLGAGQGLASLLGQQSEQALDRPRGAPERRLLPTLLNAGLEAGAGLARGRLEPGPHGRPSRTTSA